MNLESQDGNGDGKCPYDSVSREKLADDGREAFLACERGAKVLARKMEPSSSWVNEVSYSIAHRVALYVQEDADGDCSVCQMIRDVRGRYREFQQRIDDEYGQPHDVARFVRVCRICHDIYSFAARNRDFLVLFSGCLGRILNLLSTVDVADNVYGRPSREECERMIRSFCDATDSIRWFFANVRMKDVVRKVVDRFSAVGNQLNFTNVDQVRKALFVGDEESVRFSPDVLLSIEAIVRAFEQGPANFWTEDSLFAYENVKASEYFCEQYQYDYWRMVLSVFSSIGNDPIGIWRELARVGMRSYVIGRVDLFVTMKSFHRLAIRIQDALLHPNGRSREGFANALRMSKEVLRVWRKLQAIKMADMTLGEIICDDKVSGAFAEAIKGLDHFADEVESGRLIASGRNTETLQQSPESIVPIPVLTVDAQRRAVDVIKRTRNPRGKAAASSLTRTLTNRDEGYLKIESGKTEVKWRLTKDDAELTCELTDPKAWRFLEELMRRGEFCCMKAYYDSFKKALWHKARNKENIVAGKAKAASFLEQIVGVEENYGVWAKCDGRTYGLRPRLNRKLCRVFLKNFSET